MSTVFLNHQYLPMEQARISPMDRGFLFGDGIYEVIPSYHGKTVGFAPHMQRMQNGMQAIGIELDWSIEQWRKVAERLISENGSGNLGLYFHVSRGADVKRLHAYPKGVAPTVFGFAFEIPPQPVADIQQAKRYRVTSSEDMRWRRCHIKSTSLLGNVMHYQQGQDAGVDETLLFNADQQLTEASACNVFIVKHGVIATPPLDNQILPGITRNMLVDMVKKDGRLTIEERIISREEVNQADEIWLTSSSKEIAAVVEFDGQPVGNGQPGPVWQQALELYSASKFDY